MKEGGSLAKQIEGVYEAVLECAKKEFLEKGYKDASLRTIAQEAGTSTGSIYTRFGDKEGLFRAIVEPVAEEMRRMFLEIQENFHQLDDNVQQLSLIHISFRCNSNEKVWYDVLAPSYRLRRRHTAVGSR